MKPPLDPQLFDLAQILWVMHCAKGPVPRPTAAAARAFIDKELHPWELSVPEWLASAESARREAAALLGAAPADVTLVPSTSAGLTAVAQAFPWNGDAEVLVPLGEFPSNIWPWKALAARHVRFREAPLWAGHTAGRDAWTSPPPPVDVDPETVLLDRLERRTRVLAVSWVRFQDGLTLDLGRLGEACETRGIALVVDGIQGAGTLPVKLHGVAAFATGAHKGLLAPQGTGFLWTHPTLRATLAPLGSWLSVEQGSDFSRPSTDHDRAWCTDGRRLETLTPSGLLYAPLAASLRLFNAVGPIAVHTHVRRLQDALLAGLARSPAWAAEAARLAGLAERGRLSSILSLHHGGRGASWLLALQRRGIKRGIFASVREGYLRIALHGWHTEDDVERLLDWLAAAPPSTATSSRS